MSAADEVLLPGFDYGSLPAEVRIEAKAAAERIKERMRGAVVEVGTDLIQVKDRLPHGEFGKWLKAEFGMTERSAQNYMAAASLVGKCETVSFLQPRTLYLLAAPSTPESTRQEVVDRLAGGEVIPDPTIKTMVKEAKFQAREEQRRAGEVAREAKVSRRTRRTRAEREQQYQEMLRARAEKEAASRKAAELIFAAVPPAAAAEVRELLRNCGVHDLGSALLAAFGVPKQWGV
jgi:hypothetical protein